MIPLLERVSGLFKRSNTSSVKCCCKCGNEPQPPPYTVEDILSSTSIPSSYNPDNKAETSKANIPTEARGDQLDLDRVEEVRHLLRICTVNEYLFFDAEITARLGLEEGALKRTAISEYWYRLCGSLLKHVTFQIRALRTRANEPQEPLADPEPLVDPELSENLIQPLKVLGLDSLVLKCRLAAVGDCKGRPEVSSVRISYLELLLRTGNWSQLANKLILNETVLLPMLFTSPAIWDAHEKLKRILFDKFDRVSGFVPSQYAKDKHCEILRRGIESIYEYKLINLPKVENGAAS
ncbi:hypothetical protein MMC17_005709 [Xylographa soralifera]|nr:hypothetical protein [Xylographa soralifera]